MLIDLEQYLIEGKLFRFIFVLMKGLKIIFSVSFFIGSATIFAQDNGWLSMPTTKDTTIAVVNDSLNYSVGGGNVVVSGGEKLAKLEEFVRTGEGSVEGVKMDGYRVLIFFDQSKSVSESAKARFLSIYPEHKAYVDYMAPNYRVRVGNFRTKLEAEALKAELLANFPTAIVIADKIQLPKLPETSAVNTPEIQNQ